MAGHNVYAKIRTSITPNWTLFVILVFGAVLRLYHLDYQSLWDDELGAIIESDPDVTLSEAFETYKNFDNMPPMNFILLRYLFLIFGHTSHVLRIFSALSGIISIYVIFLLGKELWNKRTGLFAAVLLAINSYHIYYSQEGRPYTFFVLFTLLSYLHFVLWLKHLKNRNALYYAVFTGIMLNTHYFSVLTLLSQLLVAAYFFFIYSKDKKRIFISQFAWSAILTAFIFLPALPRLIHNANLGSMWIPRPGADVYSSYFALFYGNSELVIPIIYICILLFFVKLGNDAKAIVANGDGDMPPSTFPFVVLAPWLGIYLLVPLIRSYLVMPMMVHRYFIPLVVASSLIAAGGLSGIQSRVVRCTLAILLVFFSLTDMVIIKDYYGHAEKSQFRENANFIITQKAEDEKVVSKICWHYTYYFKVHQAKNTLVQASLNDFVNNSINDTARPASFWYAGLHETSAGLTEKAMAYLNAEYFIEKRVDLLDQYAIQYKRTKPGAVPLDLYKFVPLKPGESGVIFLDGSSNLEYPELKLEKGTYQLSICAQSLPEKPLNNINSHISIFINDKAVGGCFVKNSNSYSINTVVFSIGGNGLTRIKIAFDNDISIGMTDRNVKITSAMIQKM